MWVLECGLARGLFVQAGLPSRVPLTRSRCITWSIVVLPYLVAFCMGCGRRSGGYQHWPPEEGPGMEAVAGAWVRV